jgi:radical SAM superfamily enzyme YgiQ (UPF0313 family)
MYDVRHDTLQTVYRQDSRPDLNLTRIDRSIFEGKRYVPVTLIEAGRGCHFRCEFCAVRGNTDETTH